MNEFNIQEYDQYLFNLNKDSNEHYTLKVAKSTSFSLEEFRKKFMEKIEGVNENYFHTEPNSHFYTEIQQIITSIELGAISKLDILIGLKNTLEQGYQITKKDKFINLIKEEIKNKDDEIDFIKKIKKASNIRNNDEIYDNKEIIYFQQKLVLQKLLNKIID